MTMSLTKVYVDFKKRELRWLLRFLWQKLLCWLQKHRSWQEWPRRSAVVTAARGSPCMESVSSTVTSPTPGACSPWVRSRLVLPKHHYSHVQLVCGVPEYDHVSYSPNTTIHMYSWCVESLSTITSRTPQTPLFTCTAGVWSPWVRSRLVLPKHHYSHVQLECGVPNTNIDVYSWCVESVHEYSHASCDYSCLQLIHNFAFNKLIDTFDLWCHLFTKVTKRAAVSARLSPTRGWQIVQPLHLFNLDISTWSLSLSLSLSLSIYIYIYMCVCVCVCVWERERETDRQTDRQTDRGTDRQTEGQTDREKGGGGGETEIVMNRIKTIKNNETMYSD